MNAPNPASWVVFQTPVQGGPGTVRGICRQAEWDVMTHARPGFYTLVKAGITSEGEAERLARGTSGDPPPRPPRPQFGTSQPEGPAGPPPT
jgi:hypothetical protein